VVDDDLGMREVTVLILEHENLESRVFASATEFLALDEHHPASCLLLDNHMPGLSELELQVLLAQRNVRIPIVFMSGDTRAPDIVTAVKGGAYQFLQKPFTKAKLVSTIKEAQFLDLLCLGHSNKSVSSELGISNSTVEFHRANLNKKLAPFH
jgi:two-component system response regulator FixJ